MNRLEALTGASLVVALIQSVCTAVLVIGGARLTAGLPVLAPGSMVAPIRWFHQDTIRIPMLLLASIGAIADLVVLSWIKRLRSQPHPPWLLRKRSLAERRSQRLQSVLAIATLVLVAAESGSHAIIVHRTPVHPVMRQASTNRK